MVSELYKNSKRNSGALVLILVLVEDGLGAEKHEELKQIIQVLILVLVEDGLGA